MSWECRAAATLLAVLIVACDIRSRRIPDGITLSLAATALADAFLAGRAPGVVESCAVFAAGLPLFRLGAMGGGDVKALAAGALLLPGRLADFILVTSLAGGLLALVCLAAGLFGRGGRDGGIPYGVAIACGLCACVWTRGGG